MSLEQLDESSVARTAAELPPGRRESYVWRHCWVTGFHLELDLDSDPMHFGGRCGDAEKLLIVCPTPERAVLGADGLYHLAAGDRVVCRAYVTPNPHPCGFGARGIDEAGTADLLAIPNQKRCTPAKPYWPAPVGGRGALAAVRSQLVSELGPGCATCSNRWAMRIDHDHTTGLVRGYLCGVCNNMVDRCRHLQGCPYADYLASPPALELELLYPGYERLRAGRYATRQRCFAIVMAGGISRATRSVSSRGPPRRTRPNDRAFDANAVHCGLLVARSVKCGLILRDRLHPGQI